MVDMAPGHRADQRVEHQLLHRLVPRERVVVMRRKKGKVGGTAVMVSGEYTRGVYMEGRHEGGDEGAAEAGSVTSRLKSMLGID